MPACLNCGDTMDGWFGVCETCRTSFDAVLKPTYLPQAFNAANCINCNQKCAKKVNDVCCEKYKRKGKHCKKCPECITNIGVIGGKSFV